MDPLRLILAFLSLYLQESLLVKGVWLEVILSMVLAHRKALSMGPYSHSYVNIVVEVGIYIYEHFAITKTSNSLLQELTEAFSME